MKNVFTIYKSDLKKIVGSWVTLLIIFGITILPPLYAWLNIYASWDPYGNTKDIKVAVINNDIGANLKDINFDIGSELITSLKTNDKMGWVFCDDSDKVYKMVENGDVYAALIIPEDFSRRMTSLLDEKPLKPTIEYYVNQKVNAVAPKMTDSAANSIQKQITASILETAAKKAFEKFNELGVDLEGKYPDIEKYIDMLHLINNNFPSLYLKLDTIEKNSRDGLIKIDQKSEDFLFISGTIKDMIDFNNNFSDSLLNINAKIKEYSPEIKENFKTAQSLFLNISNGAEDILEDIKINKPEFIKDIENAQDDITSFENKLIKAKNKLIDFDDEVRSDIVDINNKILRDIKDIRQLLSDLRGSLDNTGDLQSLLGELEDLNRDIKSELEHLQSIINNVFNTVDSGLKLVESISNQLEILIYMINNNDSTENIKNKIEEIKALMSTGIIDLTKKSNVFKEVLDALNSVNESLNSLIKDLEGRTGITELKEQWRDLKSAINSIRSKHESNKREVNDEFDRLEEIFGDLSRVCRNLRIDISTISNDFIKNIDNLYSRLLDIERILEDNNNEILGSDNQSKEKIETKTSGILKKTGSLKEKLTDIKNSVKDRDNIEKILYDMQKLTYNIQSALDTVVTNMDDNIVAKIENYLTNGSLIINDINTILGNTKSDVESLSSFLKDVSKNGEVGIDKFNDLRKKLPNIEKNIKTITNKVDLVNKAVGFDDLIRILKTDPDTEGEFLSSPVKLNTHEIYKMPNYGTGLTPFYSVLALWVGGLFLSALLSTKSSNTEVKVTHKQEFFGKYLLFATVAILQGLITALGDFFILNVSVHNPVLFTLLAMFYSLLFSMIIYSLVSTIGNIGKAVAVVFMLLQLTGSGGVFPIEVTPQFFKTIHNLMPFTYAISGLREAVFGVVYNNLVKDIIVLLIFFIVFTALGLFLKEPLSKFTENFSKELKRSGVIGH